MEPQKENNPTVGKKTKEKKSFFTKKKILIILGFLFLSPLLFNTCLLYMPLSFEKQQIPRKGDLRIMTFNIAHSRGLAPFQLLLTQSRAKKNLDKIARLLNYYDPDVVALQEVDKDSSWNGRFDNLAYLAKKAGYPHYDYVLNCRRSKWPKCNYGNGILSKYPLKNIEPFTFGPPIIGQKGFLYCEIEIKKRTLPLVNVHLDYKTSSNRRKEAGKMVKYLRQKKTLPLIVGDFNGDETGTALPYLIKNLGYSAKNLYPKKGFTFSVYWPNKRIDHFLLPSYLTVENCHILKASLSDHRPVMMDLKWAKEPGKK